MVGELAAWACAGWGIANLDANSIYHAVSLAAALQSRKGNDHETAASGHRESGHTGRPALNATDRGTYVVQGKLVTDQAAIADLVDVRDDEFYVEIPMAFLASRRASGRLIGGQEFAGFVLGYEDPHSAGKRERYHEPEEAEPFRAVSGRRAGLLMER